MSDLPKSGVPSWQTAKGADTETKQEDKPTKKVEENIEPSRFELVESARKFLEEDEVKDATTDKKIAFLEKKGLENEEIEQLLGVSRNVEASNPEVKSTPTAETTTQKPIAQTSSTSTSLHTLPPPQPQQAPQPYRDTPPIITYPEFLTKPVAPPPLITPTRILNTLYAFGGLGALIYAASTYLVKPMSESLVDARHQLAETAQEKIDKFNEKLKPLVSEVPEPINGQGEAYKDAESDSEDDDPTELFHRDIGVQTSEAELAQEPPAEAQPDTVNKQTAKATLISTQLAEMDLSMMSELHEQGKVDNEIRSLTTYLDTLMYHPPSFTYGSSLSYGQKKDEDDEIGSVKKEIRAVKGLLISARSFPGVPGRAGR